MIGTFGGTALVIIGGYFASHALLALSGWTLIAISAVVVGAALLLSAVLVSTIAPAADSEHARALSSVLDSAARGDLTREVRTRDHSGTLGPALHSASRALLYLRSRLTTARTAGHETSVRAEELVGHCAAGHVAAQRAAEQGAHVAQHTATLDEELRSLRPDLDAFANSALQIGSLVQRERDSSNKIRSAGREVVGDLEAALRALELLEDA